MMGGTKRVKTISGTDPGGGGGEFTTVLAPTPMQSFVSRYP